MSVDTTTAIVGAILGPVAGLIGSRIKMWVDTRDARGRARRLMKEAADLLEFADKVQKSADAGGVVTKVRGSCMESLQTAVTSKIEEVAFAVSPAGVAHARAERRASRSVLGRLFLSARPCSWWAWVLHSLYYMMFGITVLFGGMTIYDFRIKAVDREGGMVATGFFAILAVMLNIFANAADHPASSAASVPAPPPPPGKAQSSAA
jgi:hypothetical protein